MNSARMQFVILGLTITLGILVLIQSTNYVTAQGGNVTGGNMTTPSANDTSGGDGQQGHYVPGQQPSIPGGITKPDFPTNPPPPPPPF